MGVLDENAADDEPSYLGDEPGRFRGGERGPEAITPSGAKRELGTDPFALCGNGGPHRLDGVCIGRTCVSHGGHHESLVDEAPKPPFDSRRRAHTASPGSEPTYTRVIQEQTDEVSVRMPAEQVQGTEARIPIAGQGRHSRHCGCLALAIANPPRSRSGAILLVGSAHITPPLKPSRSAHSGRCVLRGQPHRAPVLVSVHIQAASRERKLAGGAPAIGLCPRSWPRLR